MTLITSPGFVSQIAVDSAPLHIGLPVDQYACKEPAQCPGNDFQTDVDARVEGDVGEGEGKTDCFPDE